MIVALLSFYDEPPDMLARCVASLHRAGASHLIAVDGPYAAFPHEHVSSAPSQHAAIRAAAWSAGLGLTLHIPLEAWAGNEVGKRTFMHRLAPVVCGEVVEDEGGLESVWQFVIDADEVVESAPPRGTVEMALRDVMVGEVLSQEQGGGRGWRRRLFLNTPGISVGPTHCEYRLRDLVLSDSGKRGEVEAGRIEGFVLSHRHGDRSAERERAKMDYYTTMPEGGHLGCEVCGLPPTQRVRAGWRIEAGELLFETLDVCAPCGETLRQAGRVAVLGLGRNPDRVVI